MMAAAAGANRRTNSTSSLTCSRACLRPPRRSIECAPPPTHPRSMPLPPAPALSKGAPPRLDRLRVDATPACGIPLDAFRFTPYRPDYVVLLDNLATRAQVQALHKDRGRKVLLVARADVGYLSSDLVC